MTKIVAISDTHHKHYYLDLPEGDILIHAGDFTFRGTEVERYLVRDWLEHVSSRYKHVIFISGNHDIGMTPDTTRALRDKYPNIYHLHDSGCEIDGIYFYGSAYTVKFCNWGFGETEEDLVKRWNHIPKKTEILITHGPPRTVLDKNKNGECCGSSSLFNKIKQLPNLKHHIFGHIHEGYGSECIENINFHNVSILDENYKIKNKPTIIEL